MKKVNILTAGFSTPNGSAFLFPLIQHKNALRSIDINIELHHDVTDSLYDSDILIADSKFFSAKWSKQSAAIIALFKHFKEKFERVLYFDISDSTGWPHAHILPYVDGYIKSQLLKDKERYLHPFYGHRVYTDYYHRHNQVNDSNESYSEAVTDPTLLDKLQLGWNSGLADYSLFGPYRMMLYHKIPYSALLSFPKRVTSPSCHRSNDICCRMGINYLRDTVSWQRRQLRRNLSGYLATRKISRRKYYKELQTSKLVVSPFGLGEITLKDFEVFLTGGVLVKPDMSHMETWPDFFQANKTVLFHRWDLLDIESLLTDVLAHYNDYSDIAVQGQRHYRRYLVGDHAVELFCEHFSKIVTSTSVRRTFVAATLGENSA